MTRLFIPTGKRPDRRRRAVLLAVLAASAASASCHGSVSAEGAARPGLRIVSGGGVSDTIDAQLRDTVIVELRDSSGRGIPGAILRVAVAVTPPA